VEEEVLLHRTLVWRRSGVVGGAGRRETWRGIDKILVEPEPGPSVLQRWKFFLSLEQDWISHHRSDWSRH